MQSLPSLLDEEFFSDHINIKYKFRYINQSFAFILTNYRRIDEVEYVIGSYSRYRDDILRLNYQEHSILTSVQILEFMNYIESMIEELSRLEEVKSKIKLLNSIGSYIMKFSKY
jgi:hypothetical protein